MTLINQVEDVIVSREQMQREERLAQRITRVCLWCDGVRRNLKSNIRRRARRPEMNRKRRCIKPQVPALQFINACGRVHFSQSPRCSSLVNVLGSVNVLLTPLPIHSMCNQDICPLFIKSSSTKNINIKSLIQYIDEDGYLKLHSLGLN